MFNIKKKKLEKMGASVGNGQERFCLLIVLLFSRTLDLTSAVQRSLGILLVVVQTFPVYRSDRSLQIPVMCQQCLLSLMNATEDFTPCRGMVDSSDLVRSEKDLPPGKLKYWCIDDYFHTEACFF